MTEFEKASVNTNTFSLPSHDGSTLRESIHNNSIGLLVLKDLVVCWDKHSGPLQFDGMDNWQHNQIHLDTLQSDKLYHRLEMKSNPVLDGHSHCGLSEAQQYDILEEALISGNEHHC